MKLLRAIGFGAILWILIFFEVSILMFGFGIAEGNPIYYSLDFLFSSLFAILLSLVYFNGKVKKGFLQGLLLGFIMVVVSIILDSIITIPLFMKADYSFLLKGYILINELCVIIFAGFVGWIKEAKVKQIKRRR